MMDGTFCWKTEIRGDVGGKTENKVSVFGV